MVFGLVVIQGGWSKYHPLFLLILNLTSMSDKPERGSMTGCIAGVIILFIISILIVRQVDDSTSITGKIIKELSGMVIKVVLTGVFYILTLLWLFKGR